ncbi:hypothetical protein SAMN05661091_2960 [Paenibacillus uliginis N3/975]|uniref:Uncharacterized protein n=1 Tax=Paenibacillus uliginis N3/975 TaxID=1313296 RepID=A0A1X7HEV1_9BACL|nr:hypothetical protein [Paenibacillus uliginis]SMF85319.1 hypothetical protein SAMN05661091_2960 [Paenibacillus uliginis N3/975]
MLLTDLQKKTIEQMNTGDDTTLGGPAVGENIRYEIRRLTDHEYKVCIFDRMVRLDEDYFQTTSQVIAYIETY